MARPINNDMILRSQVFAARAFEPVGSTLQLHATAWLLWLLAGTAIWSCFGVVHAQVSPPDDFNPGANNVVYSLVTQPDGRIVVGGIFTTLGGQQRVHLGRLDAGGALEMTFDPGAGPSVDGYFPVYSLLVQSDGKIVIGGEFTVLAGQPRKGIGRLNPDGSLDAQFNPGVDLGINPGVFSMALQADGKILVGGSFKQLACQPRNYLGRLNSDGSLDLGFNPGSDGAVLSISIQPNGKILVGGDFTTIAGSPRRFIGRLNTDGSVDSTFFCSPGDEVICIAVQPDDRILLGGAFTNLSGQTRNHIARLNPDGSLDSSFNPGADASVYTLSLQADGKILLGGSFTNLAGQPRSYVGRLNPDGSVDNQFDSAVSGGFQNVTSLAPQQDGKLLIAGGFTTLGSLPRSYLGRLASMGLPVQTLSYDGSVTWLRGGASPEVWRAFFEFSTNGLDWISLGTGARVPGLGLQLANVSAPSNATIRARGYVTGGYLNGSSWFVEQMIGPPAISFSPYNVQSQAGSEVLFTSVAGGSEPLSYQWRKDGSPVSDGGHISGALSPSLRLSNLLKQDEGGYSLVASNEYGSVTSRVGRLTVTDPVIAQPPVDQTKQPGERADLSVAVAGTPPLSYQWWKDGAMLAHATSNTLALTNLSVSDAGNYWVAVTNQYGSTTSRTALLTVNQIRSDTSFSPLVDGNVDAVALQPDGKILLAGEFQGLNGQSRYFIGRLNVDGSLDTQFNPGADSYIYALAVQPNGKILVGGQFTRLAGQHQTLIARLNPDGSLDNSFSLGVGGGSPAVVSCLVLQADGKIVVGGTFTVPRSNIARLNSDGTFDPTFNPVLSYSVVALALQQDGKILVGSGSAFRIERLNLDGTTDTNFYFRDFQPNSITVQPDGRILVSGESYTFPGQWGYQLVRLWPDGSLDNSLNLSANGPINSVSLQANGKIIVGGVFESLGGQTRAGLARINGDGSLDSSFDPREGQQAASSFPYSTRLKSVALQADGKILIEGQFLNSLGQLENFFDRLDNSERADQTITYSGTTLTWLPTGSSPQPWRAFFDVSTNGLDWLGLDRATWVGGIGYQLSSVTLPPKATVRARGHISGGYNSASSGLMETYFGYPALLRQTSSQTNLAGATVVLSAVAVGSEPLIYQWVKDGVALTDGDNVTGALTPVLSLTNVLKRNEGSYTLVVNNNFGAVTSAVLTLTVIEPLILVQPAPQSKNAGESAIFAVVAVGSPPVNYQWWKDGATLAQGVSSALVLTNLQGRDAGNYWVVVSNQFGSLTSAVAFLSVNMATADPSFILNPDGPAGVFAVQADRRILVAGSFRTVLGQPRDGVARINIDDTLDSSFDPSVDGTVRLLNIQADGKILAVGNFGHLAGQVRTNLGRLNSDGSLDSSFNAGVISNISALAIDASGRIIVGGSFNRIAGQARTNIGRLNADGTLDPGFNPGANYSIYALALQADGKILVGGGFSRIGGQPRDYLARLNADGSLDLGFNPNPNGDIGTIAMQSDGKILLSGYFSMVGGGARGSFARLKPDGSLDLSFDAGSIYYASSLAVQADGSILLGGSFTTLGGQRRVNLGRLSGNGSLDGTFDPGANATGIALGLEPDGRILVGGYFSTLASQPLMNMGRLFNTGTAFQDLNYDGTNVTWSRGGTAPDVCRATFDYSTNGFDWMGLGNGASFAGFAYRVTNVSLPLNATIRARGYITGASGNASTWFVEQMSGPPAISFPPVGMIRPAGSMMGFTLAAGGSEPLAYQWLKDGRALSDGGTVSGALTPMLQLTNLLKQDEGGYSVVISNAYGSITSAVANLVVQEPVILTQPVGQTKEAGESVALGVSVAGTPPIQFQWWKDAALLPQATGNTLVLTNLLGADAGNYWVVVGNQYGNATSTVALLTVNVVDVDRGFNPVLGPTSSAGARIYSVAMQTDRRIVVGGSFTTPSTTNIARLNVDGTLDTDFKPGLFSLSSL